MREHRVEQHAPAALAARLGLDAHAQRQDTRRAGLMGGRAADHPPFVLEHERHRGLRGRQRTRAGAADCAGA